MIVSCSKRGLALPFANATLNQQTFDALWAWGYAPVTQAAPMGWPDSWRKNGKFLHVARLDLKGLFASVQLDHLLYGIGSAAQGSAAVPPKHLVLSPTRLTLLKHSLLVVCHTNGALHAVQVIQGDQAFGLRPTNRLTETPPTSLAPAATDTVFAADFRGDSRRVRRGLPFQPLSGTAR
jgi:hypothetical protein